MGETTISWCRYTHNLWEGCFKVSPGCEHCYAEAMNAWLRRGDNWGRTAPRRVFSPAHYRKPLAWNEAAKRAGVRERVFCGSVMDIAEVHPVAEVADELAELRNELWSTILATPWLDWLLLTKRPENWEAVLPWGRRGAFADPFRNVWLGVTVENQEYATRRLAIMRELAPRPARWFVSYEPALGPVDWQIEFAKDVRPDLVIFGDESGRKRRSAEIEWARSTRDACAAAGVTFHFKQWCGDDVDGVSGERDGKRKINLPILDGRQHAEMPSKPLHEAAP